MTITDVKECAIDRSRVVVHIRPFKLLKTLYGCLLLFYATVASTPVEKPARRRLSLRIRNNGGSTAVKYKGLNYRKCSLPLPCSVLLPT